MKSPAELKRHRLDNTLTCEVCLRHVTTFAGDPCLGKTEYFTPLVKNITVKQPNLCVTHHFDWNDKCTQCGVYEDDL